MKSAIPKWEHTTDELKAESVDKAVTGDIIELSADIKNYPEKASVTFDIYDVSSGTPLRINSVETKNENGIAKAKWTVEDPEKKGENLKLAFEAIARSKASPRVEVPIIPKIDCDFVEAPDILFHHNSAVPCLDQNGTLISSLASVFKFAKENSDKEILLFGHSDTSGDPEYNYDLSQWRAEGIKALLDNKKDAWLDIVELASKVEDYQQILKSLYNHGWPTDPGKVDNANGPKTKEAIKAFQKEYNTRFSSTLKEDGAMGQNTWSALFEVIRDLLVESVKSEIGEEPSGLVYSSNHNGVYPCGESFPIDEKGRDDYKSRENRRVEIVFFDKGKAPELIKPENKKKVKKSEAVIYDKRITERKPFFSKPVKAEDSGTIILEWVYPQVLDSSKPHKQYVNLDSNGKEQGNELTIKVKTKDLKANTAGKNVYWRVTADNKNSKRNSPKTGIMDKAGGKLVEFTAGIANLDIPFEKNEASIVLACGLAGGDRFTVEAGTDGENFTSSFVVENWRRLWYEQIMPNPQNVDQVSGFTVFTSDNKPKMPVKAEKYMKKVMDKCFVEFDCSRGDFYNRTDLPLNGKCNVFDGEYFKKSKGKKAVVLTLDQADKLLQKKAKHLKDNKTTSIIWSDYLAETVTWEQTNEFIYNSQNIVTFKKIFENILDSFRTRKNPTYAIDIIEWRVTHWYDNKSKNPEWKLIKAEKDPGWKFKGGILTEESDIKAHIKFKDYETLTISFPDSKSTFPGRIIKKDEKGNFVDKNYLIGLTVYIKGVAYEMGFNGAALQGKIWMNTFAGSVKDEGMAATVLHELGHNMGQVYADKSVDKDFGRHKTKPVPGIPFPDSVPEGFVYGGHGHQGTHCASGLSKNTRKLNNYQVNEAYKERNCIMFGGSDMMDDTEYHFCKNCIEYIKAENLENIQKPWTD